MTIGIYKLSFKGTDKVYIGQSKNIEKRYTEHIFYMQNPQYGKCSKKLLSAYSEYGTPTLEIILECELSTLDTLENEAIEIFNSVKNGFNTFSTEGGSIRSQRGVDHSGSKYSKFLILRIFSLLYKTTLSYKKISIRCNLENQYLVNNIASGIHSWLKDEYPQEYQKMLDNKCLRNKLNVRITGTTHTLESPEGHVFEFTNIAEFCREQPSLNRNLVSSKSNIAKVLKGTKKSHLGWKLYNKKI